MCTAGRVATKDQVDRSTTAKDQKGSKCCCKGSKGSKCCCERIEVLLQKDRKYRSAATRDQEDPKAAVEDQSVATKDQEY